MLLIKSGQTKFVKIFWKFNKICENFLEISQILSKFSGNLANLIEFVKICFENEKNGGHPRTRDSTLQLTVLQLHC